MLIGSPLVVIWLVQLALLTTSQHVVWGKITQHYRIEDPQGYESSYLIDGGKVLITCENDQKGTVTFTTLESGTATTSVTKPSPYVATIEIRGSILEKQKEQYFCNLATGDYLGIEAIHCDPLLMSPPIKGCKAGELCLVRNSTSFMCGKMDEDSCFLSTLYMMKKSLQESFPKPRRACANTKDAENATISYGLCHARTVTKAPIFGLSQAAQCNMLKEIVFNGKSIKQDEFVFETKDPSQWTMTYESDFNSNRKCILYTAKNETVASFTGKDVDYNLTRTKTKSPTPPSKIRLHCTIQGRKESDLWTISAYVIYYNKDPSNYAVNISIDNSTEADSLDLVCSCKVPKGFVCGLSWTDPGKAKVDYDYDSISLRKSMPASEVAEKKFECFLKVFVHEYPISPRFLILPDLGSIKAAQFYTRKELKAMFGPGYKNKEKKKGNGVNEDDSEKGKSKSSEETKSGSSGWIYAIVAIVIILVVIAVVIAVIFAVIRIKSARQKREENEKLGRIQAAAAAEQAAAQAAAAAEQAARMEIVKSLQADKENEISEEHLDALLEKKDEIKALANTLGRKKPGKRIITPDYLAALKSPKMTMFLKIAEQWDKLIKAKEALVKLIPKVAGYVYNCRFNEMLIMAATWVFKNVPGCKLYSTQQNPPAGTKPTSLHMNHVRSLYCDRKYILSQAPREIDMELFIQTILQQNVKILVTLLEENEQVDAPNAQRPRFYPYFKKPQGSSQTYGLYKLNVTKLFADPAGLFQTRDISIRNASDDKQLTTLLIMSYLKWGDCAAAGDISHVMGIVKAVNHELANLLSAPASPSSNTTDVIPAAQPRILVHCAAGIGRSGLLVAVDWVITYLEDFGAPINLLGIVEELRKDRAGAVQTIDQYLQLHFVAAEWLRKKFIKRAPRIEKSMAAGATAPLSSKVARKSNPANLKSTKRPSTSPKSKTAN